MMRRIGHSIKILSEKDDIVYKYLLKYGIPQRYAYFSSAYIDHKTVASLLFKAMAMCRQSPPQVTLKGLFCAYMRLEFVKKEIYNFPYRPYSSKK